MTTKKPTKKEILASLKSEFGLDVPKLEDEVYLKALNDWEQLSIRTIASRCRFYLTGADRDAEKESIDISGVFLGSRDLVTAKKPLGKNKVQLLTFLMKGEDDRLRVFSEPSTPTHFKGFKKEVFGKLIEGKMLMTGKDDRTFCTPKDVVVTDPEFTLDTSQIEVLDVQGVYDLPEYRECAVLVEINSIWPLRIPEWEADNWEDEDYPAVVKETPVFQIYAKAEEDAPILRASLHPVHIGRPIIQMEDFDVLWQEGTDIEDELSPSFSGRKVILFGQKRTNSSYEDREYVEFDLNAVIEVTEEPIVVKPAAETIPGKSKDKGDKEAKKVKKAEKEAKKVAVRVAKVAESVEALREEATPTIVRSMHDEKFFKDVEDNHLQAMIDEEMRELGIEPVADVEEESDKSEEVPEEETEETTKDEKPAEETEDVFGEE
ncbi:MAG: hypothetical protein KAS66_08225 [Candidatus Omnitrophica bacterium]|nr:hypothetical protein [Candidatus Omnitrophota bacterium]